MEDGWMGGRNAFDIRNSYKKNANALAIEQGIIDRTALRQQDRLQLAAPTFRETLQFFLWTDIYDSYI